MNAYSPLNDRRIKSPVQSAIQSAIKAFALLLLGAFVCAGTPEGMQDLSSHHSNLSSKTPHSTDITLALDWTLNPNHAPILIAEQNGYFKQAHLKVKLLTPTETEEPLRLLLAHHADVAISYPTDLLLAQSRGLPVQQIGTLIDHSVNGLAVLKSSHIDTLTQLDGKKIGVSGGVTGSALLKVMLKHAGVNVKSVQFETVQMGLAAALLSRKVDAVWGFSVNVEPVLLAQEGHPVKLFMPSAEDLPQIDGYIFVDQAHTLSPATIQALMHAIDQGAQFLKAHPHQSWAILTHQYPAAFAATPTSEKALYQVFLATIPLFAEKASQVNMNKLEKLRQFMTSQGIIH